MRIILSIFISVSLLLSLSCVSTKNYEYNEREIKAKETFYTNPKIKINQLTNDFEFIEDFNWNTSGDLIAISGRKSKEDKATIWIYDLVKNELIDLAIIGDRPVWYGTDKIIYKKHGFNEGRSLKLYDLLTHKVSVLLTVCTATYPNGSCARDVFFQSADMVISPDRSYIAFVDGFCRAYGGDEEIVLVDLNKKSGKQIYRTKVEYLNIHLLGFDNNILIFIVNKKFIANKKLIGYDLISADIREYSFSEIDNPIYNSELSTNTASLLIIEEDPTSFTEKYSKHTLFLNNLKAKTKIKLLNYFSGYYRDSYPKWSPNGKVVALIIEDNLVLIDCSKLLLN